MGQKVYCVFQDIPNQVIHEYDFESEEWGEYLGLGWAFVGVYTTEELAKKACLTKHFGYVMFELDDFNISEEIIPFKNPWIAPKSDDSE